MPVSYGKDAAASKSVTGSSNGSLVNKIEFKLSKTAATEAVDVSTKSKILFGSGTSIRRKKSFVYRGG